MKILLKIIEVCHNVDSNRSIEEQINDFLKIADVPFSPQLIAVDIQKSLLFVWYKQETKPCPES